MAESAARIEAVTRLQQRWGAGIIRRGVEVGDAGLRVAPVRGTGVAALDALLGREFGHGLANGDKEHDPRVGERRFMGRNASRVDAMHAKRSITSTEHHPSP